jgi:hypothetical protein
MVPNVNVGRPRKRRTHTIGNLVEAGIFFRTEFFGHKFHDRDFVSLVYKLEAQFPVDKG